MADTTEEKMELDSLKEVHQMLRINESSMTPMKVVALESEWKKLKGVMTMIAVNESTARVLLLRLDFAHQRRLVLDLMFRIFHDCRVMEMEDSEPA